MGRLMGGPYYFLVGRTGNNVGRVRNGKNTFSMRPVPSSKPPTEAQLAVRVPFGIFTAWLSWISPIIEIGFQEHDEDESAMNAAVGYNIKNAITGVYPMQAIDYPNVLLSRGKVSGPSSPVMATTVDAQLDISWSDVIESTIGSLTDMATFVVIQFLKPIVDFINVGFMVEAANADMYAHNMAVSYNKKHALAGVYPDVSIDYSKVLVAQGSLSVAVDPVVSVVPDGLRFGWATGSWMDFTERRHMAMMMAYFPELGRAAYSMNGATRYEGTDVLFLSDDLKNAYMETYLSFVAVGSNEVANSVSLGDLNKG